MSNIYNELLQYVMRRDIEHVVSKLEYNITDKANSLATEILEEIVSVLKSYELFDFNIVEKIVCISHWSIIRTCPKWLKIGFFFVIGLEIHKVFLHPAALKNLNFEPFGVLRIFY